MRKRITYTERQWNHFTQNLSETRDISYTLSQDLYKIHSLHPNTSYLTKRPTDKQFIAAPHSTNRTQTVLLSGLVDWCENTWKMSWRSYFHYYHYCVIRGLRKVRHLLEPLQHWKTPIWVHDLPNLILHPWPFPKMSDYWLLEQNTYTSLTGESCAACLCLIAEKYVLITRIINLTSSSKPRDHQIECKLKISNDVNYVS